jgi:Putative transposase DNA-binding domain/Helix-turn-helix domain
VTRAIVFNLDLSRSQERLAYSYSGARRFAYNWAIGVARENLETRSAERAAGVAEDDLTPAMSWSAYSLGRRSTQGKRRWRPGGARSPCTPCARGSPTRPQRWPTSKIRRRELDRADGWASPTQVPQPIRPLGELRRDQPPALVAPSRPPPHPAHAAPAQSGRRCSEKVGQPRLDAHHRVHPPALQLGRAETGPDPKGDHLSARRPLAGGLLRALSVVVDRFYPSSKTCSCCGAARAKLPLSTRVFECERCGASVDRDVNAARNIAREGARLLSEQSSEQLSVAGLRPETLNADPRSRQTRGAHAPMAAVA